MKINSKISYQEDAKKKAISLTTYRALFVAKLLCIKPMSYEEILYAFSLDEFLVGACHKDTVLNTVNSLRKGGFEIEKPKPSNDYKFKLISHNFKININEEQIEALHLMRNSLYYQNNYKLIFEINQIYNKIIELSQTQDTIDKIEATNYLRYVDKKILNTCLKLCKEKADAKLHYSSPLYGNEPLKIRAEKVIFTDNRLYLWSYSYKYNMPCYLRIDKIKEIQKDKVGDDSNIVLTNFVEYELTGNAVKKFIPKDEEIIVAQEKNRIVVKANVINKFYFFQRIISFADECKILSPENIRKDFVKHLDRVVGVYKNGD